MKYPEFGNIICIIQLKAAQGVRYKFRRTLSASGWLVDKHISSRVIHRAVDLKRGVNCEIPKLKRFTIPPPQKQEPRTEEIRFGSVTLDEGMS